MPKRGGAGRNSDGRRARSGQSRIPRPCSQWLSDHRRGRFPGRHRGHRGGHSSGQPAFAGPGSHRQTDRRLVAQHQLTGTQQARCHAGRTEISLADIGERGWHGGDADRAEPVFGGKSLGLGQGFAGDGGDIGAPAAPDIIIGQIVNRIGGGPHQGAAHVIFGSTGGVQRQIADLVVRDQHLGAHSLAVQRQPGLAQDRKLAGQIRGVQRHLAHQTPAGADAMQQHDAVYGQGQGEIGLHGLALASGTTGRNSFRRIGGNLQQIPAKGKKTKW